MVSKASDDLPDPETPVITVSVFRGISRLMFLRLCSRAPRMTMCVLDMAWHQLLSRQDGCRRRAGAAAAGELRPRRRRARSRNPSARPGSRRTSAAGNGPPYRAFPAEDLGQAEGFGRGDHGFLRVPSPLLAFTGRCPRSRAGWAAEGEGGSRPLAGQETAAPGGGGPPPAAPTAAAARDSAASTA